MKTKLCGLSALLLFFVAQISFAQTKTVTGTVSDGSGMPLPGVNIVIQGTTQGANTDFNGKYSISANTGDVLKFSFLGYKETTATVGLSSTIDVSLEEDAATLDEVVVTALGIEKKKDDDVSSSTTVSTEAIGRANETGLIQGMAGKTSGLRITRNTGDPGAGAYIQIRGQNTINGASAPLIILDGTPIDNSSIGGGTAGVAQQSRLNDIPQDDIESVTVLKGAAAAAVWGTGAANGVIVIKTKSGASSGKKVSVNVRSTVTVDEINIEFDKQSQFGQGFPQWWYGDLGYSDGQYGVYYPNTGFSWGDTIGNRAGGDDAVTVGNQRFESATGNIIYPLVTKNDNGVYNNSNRDQVFGTGITYDNSVSASFNGDDSNTFLSFSDLSQDGIIQGKSNYRRQSLRLNQVSELSDKFTAKFNVQYTKTKSDRVQQGSNLQGLYLGYLRTAPDFDNRDYIGTYYDSDNVPTANSHRGYRNYLGSGAPVYNNPGWTINEQDNPNNVERFIVSPELNWKIRDNINIVAKYGLDYYTDHRETYFPVNSAAGLGTGSFSQSDIQNKVENINVFAQSSHTLTDKIDLDVVVGTNFFRNQYSVIGGSSAIFTNPDLGDLRIFGNATSDNETPSKFIQETRKHGVYGVFNFNVADQLYVELTGRVERPSTLEKNIFSPSASVGWKFSQLLDDSILSFGKLRASYGEVGIEPGAYASSTTYSPGGITSSWGDGLTAANYGNPFTRSVTLGNPDLTEERVKEIEIGTDLRFFNDRLSLGLTYYDRTTEDAILNLDVSPSTGFSGTLANAAEISNKGLEVDLSGILIRNADLTWRVNANFSYNRNMVESLSGVESVFLAGFTGTSSRVVEGQPMASLWGTGFQKNDDGSYVLDADGFPVVSSTEGVLGDPNPDWIGGLGTVLTYKNFTLSAQFETSQGNDHWTGTEGVLKYFGIHPETANISTATQDMPTYGGRTVAAGDTFRGNIYDFGGGPVALDADWYTAEGGGFGNQSESFVQDASWTRLREVTLGYDLPFKTASSIGFDSISFAVSGRNLALWTDIEGFDPDINLTGATLGRGLDYFTNPATQSYAFTVKLGF